MTKTEQIAQFVDEYIAWPRVRMSGFEEIRMPWEQPEFCVGFQGQRPTLEALVNELLGVAEFRALQLGTWLNTADGQIIVQAVESVSPPFYRQDIELLAAALQYAAEHQQKAGRQKAGRFAIRAVGAAAVLGVLIAASNSGFDEAA